MTRVVRAPRRRRPIIGPGLLPGSLPQLSVENLKRLNQCLLPPSPNRMQSLYEDGFQDALRFLRREAWTG